MAANAVFVLGGANTLHTDLAQAHQLVIPDTMIFTNNAGRDFPGPVPHWVTLHTEKMATWMAERKEAERPDAGQFWTSNTKTIPPEHEQMYKRVDKWDGSSGLLAVTVALYLGYTRIVLCGVPMDTKAAHYDDGAWWRDAPRYRSAWTRHLPKMKGKVKSFTGWTERILGEPTQAWIDGKED